MQILLTIPIKARHRRYWTSRRFFHNGICLLNNPLNIWKQSIVKIPAKRRAKPDPSKTRLKLTANLGSRCHISANLVNKTLVMPKEGPGGVRGGRL
uniref:Uncharacterized protein n=1 Tax=Sphaerodactylus townsendi TaxID=933632 RepID=A0ACB8FTS6_9SAUR